MHLATPTRLLRWPLALLACAVAAPAPACTVPVFRYALERWDLSPYEVIVYHRGELPANAGSFLDSLPAKGNLIVTLVDLDGKVSPSLAKLWDQHGQPATLPWVIVRRPDAGAKVPPAWTGPLEIAKLRQLVDSPIRQKTVAALSRGSTVFVLLLSGDRAADEATATLLQSQLARLEKLVKLPVQSGDGPRIRLALPLAVSFTILPLKRDEPGEEAFVRLLLGSEDDLPKVRGPIVFPIFGRGRLLGSLYGKDLDADNLLEVVSFLCGECSCQVKELNPGMDLPIVADWPAIFERIGPAGDSGPETPAGVTRLGARAKPLVGVANALAGTSKSGGPAKEEVRVAVSQYPPEMPNTGTPNAPPAAATASHRRWLWSATVAAALLVLATGAWAFIRLAAVRRTARGSANRR